jgi:hypothetical protein
MVNPFDLKTAILAKHAQHVVLRVGMWFEAYDGSREKVNRERFLLRSATKRP